MPYQNHTHTDYAIDPVSHRPVWLICFAIIELVNEEQFHSLIISFRFKIQHFQAYYRGGTPGGGKGHDLVVVGGITHYLITQN